MAIIRLYHGTSAQRANNIIKNGFEELKNKRIWGCSDPEKTYLYHIEQLAQAEGYEDYEEEYKIYLCLNKANESAQITSAFEESPLNYTVVFEFIIDTTKTNFMEFVIPDQSPNMEYSGAIEVPTAILNKYWKEGQIERKTHYFKFYSRLSLLYIQFLYQNEYLQDSIEKMNPIDQEVLKLLNDDSYCIEDLMCTSEELTEEEIF